MKENTQEQDNTSIITTRKDINTNVMYDRPQHDCGDCFLDFTTTEKAIKKLKYAISQNKPLIDIVKKEVFDFICQWDPNFYVDFYPLRDWMYINVEKPKSTKEEPLPPQIRDFKYNNSGNISINECDEFDDGTSVWDITIKANVFLKELNKNYWFDSSDYGVNFLILYKNDDFDGLIHDMVEGADNRKILKALMKAGI